jgi:hypothetical protein
MMPAIADDLIVRVGIKVSAPIRADREDNNGNFHCRGRDLYDGPQAKADECASSGSNYGLLLQANDFCLPVIELKRNCGLKSLIYYGSSCPLPAPHFSKSSSF